MPNADSIVFDMSEEIASTPNIFLKKEWLNIMDSQNQSYSSNQCIIETSQICNSGKYLSYREGFLLMPLLITLVGTGTTGATPSYFTPANGGTSCEYAVGLKNWFGNMIHAIALDMNGITIVQQTNFVNMWNSFRLITSLSYNDIITSGCTIGFYLDDARNVVINNTPTGFGMGVSNNNSVGDPDNVPRFTEMFNGYTSNGVNNGFYNRLQYINYDPDAIAGTNIAGNNYSSVLPPSACNNIWKSYVFNKVNATANNTGVYQIAVTATVYLKHIHPFFAMCPLMKGVFFRMTLSLNNTSTQFTVGSGMVNGMDNYRYMLLNQVNNPLGGINPLMVADFYTGGKSLPLGTYYANVSVGATCLANNMMYLPNVKQSPLSKSVYLYLPAYVFSPVFEQAYLKSPVKRIVYDDVYEYTCRNIGANQNFNNLLTNGLAGIKSLLIIPFFSEDTSTTSTFTDTTAGTTTTFNTNTGLPQGIPCYQSPFDPAGTGATSPLAMLGNFNVVVSGENIIYNQMRYSFENFNQHLYGCNATQHGQQDGLTSSLLDSLGFEMEYCYYYFDLSRYLPVEESVAKSVQIQGTNMCSKALNLFCFISYETSIAVNVLTGAKV